MINISKEEIRDKMFFVRDEDSNQPIAVIKVADLLEIEVKRRVTNKELEEELEKTNNRLYKLLSCLYGNTLGQSDIDYIMSDKPAFMEDLRGKEE